MRGEFDDDLVAFLIYNLFWLYLDRGITASSVQKVYNLS